jgi:methyl-accepting chemotaxis protein
MQIKTKLLMFGVSIIFLMTVYQLSDNYVDYKNSLAQTKLQHSSQFKGIFEHLLKEQYVLFGLGLTAVLENHQLMQLFAEQKREELYKELKHYHDVAREEFLIEHIHLHLAPATSFLRVHLPNKYGDDLSNFRLMVVETNKTLKPKRGLEVGREGLRLRLIYPAFYQKQHIGSIEISGEPLRLAHHLKNVFGVEYAVSIKQSVFDKAQRFKSQETDIKLGDQIFYAFSSPASSEFIKQYQEDRTDYVFDQQLHTTYKIPLYDFANQYIGDLLLIENIDSIQKAVWYKFIWHLIVSLFIAILMISLLSWFITRSIHNPLQYIVNIAEKISAGYLNQYFEENHRHDEIGRLAIAMQLMTERLRGNLLQVQEVIEEIMTMSDELKQTAEQIAQNSSTQTEHLEKTNQSMLHLTNSVGQNATSANYTLSRAKEAAQLAQQGDRAILDTTLVMEEITERINIVREIAFQTRLLALNAAIEAAKAGEQGLGFEVVAGEVRQLSDRSHETVLSISELTDNSQKVSDYAKKMFNRILPEVQETAQLIDNINQICLHQTENINEINGLMLKLESITHQNLAASEQLAGASADMNAQAQQLSKLMNHFTL